MSITGFNYKVEAYKDWLVMVITETCLCAYNIVLSNTLWTQIEAMQLASQDQVIAYDYIHNTLHLHT